MIFLQQVGVVAIWVVMLILYAHLIPVLRSLGTALLTGASIASVVIGLAAQSTLGNLVAGIAITLYRPFRLGERLQVTAPTGTEVGNVEMLSLGCADRRRPSATRFARSCSSSWRNASRQAGWTPRTAAVRVSPSPENAQPGAWRAWTSVARRR
jgi:uncharacterized protein with PQ loop repeat